MITDAGTGSYRWYGRQSIQAGKENTWTKNRTFRGGIHPLKKDHHGKYLSEKSKITKMKPPAELVIPVGQHIGAPAEPIVKVNEKVLMGQKIADACGFVSVPIHSSVSGTVKAIENRPCMTGGGRIVHRDRK